MKTGSSPKEQPPSGEESGADASSEATKARRLRWRTRAVGKRRGIRPPHLLAAAAIVAAIAALQGARYSSEASDAYAKARVIQAKRSALLQNAASWVFETIGKDETRLIIAQTLEDQVRRAASHAHGDLRRALLERAREHGWWARRIRKYVATHTEDPYVQFVLSGESGEPYSFAQHLANEEARIGLVLEPVGASEAIGDDYAHRAVRSVAVTIIASIAFLFGAIAEVSPRGQRLLLSTGFALLALALLALWVFSRPGFS
jgi:hypothetical protein